MIFVWVWLLVGAFVVLVNLPFIIMAVDVDPPPKEIPSWLAYAILLVVLVVCWPRLIWRM